MKFLSCHERQARGSFDFPIELYYVDAMHSRYEMPFHWHMEHEFILILEGQFSITLDAETHLLQKGDCVFIPSGVLHGGTPHQCIYECVVFDLDRFVHDTHVCSEKLNLIFAHGVQLQFFTHNQDRTSQTIDHIFQALETEHKGYELEVVSLIWQFIASLFQQELYIKSTEENYKSTKRTLQMKNVLRRIRKDFASPLTLDNLADEATMAPKYFCRIFAQVTGRTPIDYLNYYRIECASEMLCSTTQSITDIALSCGFNDLSYFVKLFRRHKGVNASEYRKIHKNIA